MLNIVFGSIKTSNSRVAEQEFDFASVKVEASRGPKTSRRILFNRPACKLMELEDGVQQEMLFGFAQPEEGGVPRLFVINTAEFQHEVDQKTYMTSKNKAAYHESKEKGKAISSKPLFVEICDFLDIAEDAGDVDFRVELYNDEGEAPVYELVRIVEGAQDTIDETTDAAPETVAETVATDAVEFDNGGDLEPEGGDQEPPYAEAAMETEDAGEPFQPFGQGQQ